MPIAECCMLPCFSPTQNGLRCVISSDNFLAAQNNDFAKFGFYSRQIQLKLLTTEGEAALSRNRYLFTSESVTEGHPDKIADQISDAILDACLTEDPGSRVACETLLTTGLAFIAGEITTKAYVDFPAIARGTVMSVGYTDATYGFDHETCAVISSIHEQSPDIKQGVDPGGAGDQGMMFGYASNENDRFMPTPIYLAHRLV